MQNEPCPLAFVSGSDEEKEKQKSKIQEYCKTRLDILSSDIEFVDWENLICEKLKKLKKLKELKEWNENGTKAKDTKAEYVVVITDLGVISKNPEILASNLYDVLVNRHTRIEVINEEHRDLLEKYQPDRLTKDQLEFIKPRLLAGLVEVCCKILKDDDK